jgi:hypothetical protein
MITFQLTDTTEFPSPIPCAMLSFRLLVNDRYDGDDSFIYVDAVGRPRAAHEALAWDQAQLAAFQTTIIDGWLDEAVTQINVARHEQRQRFQRGS